MSLQSIKTQRRKLGEMLSQTNDRLKTVIRERQIIRRKYALLIATEKDIRRKDKVSRRLEQLKTDRENRRRERIASGLGPYKKKTRSS